MKWPSLRRKKKVTSKVSSKDAVLEVAVRVEEVVVKSPKTIVVGSGLGGVMKESDYLTGTITGNSSNGYVNLTFDHRQEVRRFKGTLPKAYRHLSDGKEFYEGPIFFGGMRVKSSRVKPYESGKGIGVRISLHEARGVVHKALNSVPYQAYVKSRGTLAGGAVLLKGESSGELGSPFDLEALTGTSVGGSAGDTAGLGGTGSALDIDIIEEEDDK